MSKRRATIAKRLVEAQHTAAMLTTASSAGTRSRVKEFIEDPGHLLIEG